MYNIGVFIAGTKYYSQNCILTGIMEEARQRDIILTIITCDVWTMSDAEYIEGEMDIVKVPDLTKFDGVIIHEGSFYASEMNQAMEEKLRELNVPYICIGGQSADGYNMMVENKDVMFEMFEHLISVHKCKKFGILSGPVDNDDANGRLKGIKLAFATYGIEWDETYHYVGNYHTDSGLAASSFFYHMPDGLPEAIVCFNDNMAMGLMFGLEKKGIRVPEDVLVTGFDEVEMGMLIKPSLTTVRRKDKLMGKKAVSRLISVLEGNEEPRTEIFTSELVLGESCGCKDERVKDLEHVPEKYAITRLKDSTYSEVTKSCLADFSIVTSYKHYISLAKKYLPMVEGTAVLICLNRQLEPSQCYVAAGRYCGQYVEDMEDLFDEKDLLPSKYKIESAKDFDVVLPLHHGRKHYGHIVIRNNSDVLSNDVYSAMFNGFNIGLFQLERMARGKQKTV